MAHRDCRMGINIRLTPVRATTENRERDIMRYARQCIHATHSAFKCRAAYSQPLMQDCLNSLLEQKTKLKSTYLATECAGSDNSLATNWL